MLNLKKFAAAGVLATLLAGFGASDAEAATCSLTDVTVSLACANVDGNDSASSVDGLFGFDFDFAGKVESASGSDGLLTVSGAAKAGEWSVDGWEGVSAAILVIKGGPAFAAYLLDLSAGLTGTWSTAGLMNPGGNQPDVSHISLYTNNDCEPGSLGCFPPPEVVPLPAGLPLILSALGLGLLVSRRRS